MRRKLKAGNMSPDLSRLPSKRNGGIRREEEGRRIDLYTKTGVFGELSCFQLLKTPLRAGTSKAKGGRSWTGS